MGNAASAERERKRLIEEVAALMCPISEKSPDDIKRIRERSRENLIVQLSSMSTDALRNERSTRLFT
jgi:hypothetical protein